MEKAKTTNSTKDIEHQVKNDWGGGHCPVWIFGNKNSADKDLKEKFEVIEDEKKD